MPRQATGQIYPLPMNIQNPDTITRRRQRAADLAEHTPLVRSIAGRIRRRLPPNVDMDDLMQVGLIGLNEALSRFERGPDSSFETYAARRIEGAMLDALRANDMLSRDARSRLREIRGAVQRLEHELGRAPRAKEVANELDWPLDKLHESLVDAGAAPKRAGDEDLEHGDEPFGASVSDEGHSDPMLALQQRQRHAALSAAFDALEEAERYVMESIYEHGLPLRQIGQTLGVSESRVSQMSAAIVAKLRRRLRDV
jgi:RNA polymerase sigma factor for flagellar operon FliA